LRAERNLEPTVFYNVGMTDEEMTEIILLIDDEAVDEELLNGIRKKLYLKRKQLRQRTNRAQVAV